ncbi:MAG: LamG domain-containing protein, partial [Kiritimatiellae bacterium]|nr:LamG domain-containing protein [Kiritimatiellia bacterium]
MELASAESGFPLERAKPDYYLSDEIEPPDDVDWPSTYAAFLALPDAERANFIFDEDSHRLFAAKGGTVNFSWSLTDGSVRLMTYTVSLACSGRPRRIYWTDYPYNSPGINLAGKFVKFFGSEEILTPRYGSVTNVSAGIQQVITNRIVSGLSVDPSTQVLYAYGQLQGQVVMAYYDAGTFERLLHVQTVEVCRPEVNRLTGEIGRALTPNGRAGYSQVGLRAQPQYVPPSDNRGDWYYQHQGQYSYSPKHGNVYPLRPTKACPWNMAVYWMETDEMEVDWPFELDQYECDWPADATVFVRGDAAASVGRPIYVPTTYTATLMAYQEPEGHAHAVTTDGTFTTLGEGYSLLKLTADDNVWFVPIQSVLRTNTNYFTLVAEDIRVGSEVKMRGGSVAGTAPGFSPECDPASPGSIYEAASAPVWNPDIYVAAKPSGTADVPTDIPETSADTNKYESVIYAVSARGTSDAERPTLEVWWNTTIQEAGMGEPLTIPTLPQVYAIRWPEAGETPQIVLASQLGSASESVFSHNMGLYLSAEDSAVEIPPRKYFDETDGGTVMFWVKADAGVAADAPVAGLHPADYLSLIGIDGSLVPLADSGAWHHVAIVFQPSEALRVYVDGVEKGTYAYSVASEDLMNDWVVDLGRDASSDPATPGLTFGEILMWNRAFSAEEIAVERFKVHIGPENHLTGCYSFIDGRDLSVTGTDRRTFTDKVLGMTCFAYACLAEENGPPALGTGLIDPDRDRVPKIYVQNDPDKVGYNPNEEHAIVQATADGYVAWALRTDLNSDGSSAPGVLVEYVKDGRKTMQWFDVAVTNAVYPELAAACVAGKAFPGPHPIDFFDDPWCREDTWDEPVATAPAFRDRKGQLWARAAGTATMRLYYRMQEGFAFPSIDQANWPSVGTAIPWLALLGGDPTSSSVLTAKPSPWVWRVTWPDTVPEMEIG